MAGLIVRDSDDVATTFFVVADTKERLLKLAGVDPQDYAAIILQGSGTFCVEATLGTAFPKDSDNQILIISNGAYGERQKKICDYVVHQGYGSSPCIWSPTGSMHCWHNPRSPV